MARLIAIVAFTENGIMGNANSLPWNCKDDLKHFKEVTKGHTVVMGRKTYESIGKPLPDRLNIVLTRAIPILDKYQVDESVLLISNKQQVLDIVANAKTQNVFVIGGAEIYKLFDGHYDAIYETKLHASIEGDTEIPDMHLSNLEEWRPFEVSTFEQNDRNDFSGTITRWEKYKL